MNTVNPVPNPSDTRELTQPRLLDLRIVAALAGDRDMNAREQAIVDRLQEERGEQLFTDLLYAITNHPFPSRQAKQVWHDVKNHRQQMSQRLGRDVGLAVAAHDFLVNVSGQLRNMSLIDERRLSALTSVATHDGLTGLYDHATFKNRLQDEMDRQVRYGGDISLLMIDIDHFKNINDTLGHAGGDSILQEVAAMMRDQVRRSDTAARYGGEEFSIILPQTALNAGYIFAERLRAKVESSYAENEPPVTVSVGVATSTADDPLSMETLINTADKELYNAKHGGRNKVCVAAGKLV